MKKQPQYKYFTDINTRKEIDLNLHSIAVLNAEIGLDVPKYQKEIIMQQIKDKLKIIKTLDLEFYKMICPDKEN